MGGLRDPLRQAPANTLPIRGEVELVRVPGNQYVLITAQPERQGAGVSVRHHEPAEQPDYRDWRQLWRRVGVDMRP